MPPELSTDDEEALRFLDGGSAAPGGNGALRSDPIRASNMALASEAAMVADTYTHTHKLEFRKVIILLLLLLLVVVVVLW